MREDVPFVKQLSDADQNLLIVAPTNEAIARLGKKPWGFPRNIESLEREGSSEKDIDIAIQRNIIDFVRSHVIILDDDYSSFNEEKNYAVVHSAAMKDKIDTDDILLRKEDGSFFVASTKNVEFNEVKSMKTGVNGVVLVIDACLTWPDF